MDALTSCGRRFFGPLVMNSGAACRRLSLLNSHHFPTIPSSTTPCIPWAHRCVSVPSGSPEKCSFTASSRFGETSPLASRFVDVMWPNQVHYLTDWSFASGCSPQGLSAPQLPPAIPVASFRPGRGLSPRQWCAFTDALAGLCEAGLGFGQFSSRRELPGQLPPPRIRRQAAAFRRLRFGRGASFCVGK